MIDHPDRIPIEILDYSYLSHGPVKYIREDVVKAEIELLRAERDFDRAHIESLQNKIAQASAEVVALEDEVERLKWLEKTTNRAGHLSIAMQEIERLQQKRNEIIERCAEVCDEEVRLTKDMKAALIAGICAAAIRALKE